MAESRIASPTDLSNRWRALSAAERAQAEVLLGDAQGRALLHYPAVRARVDTDADYRTQVVAILCAVVKRMMLRGDDVGVTTQQRTAGPFTRSETYDNPQGDMYFTAAEKATLAKAGAAGGAGPLPQWGNDSATSDTRTTW